MKVIIDARFWGPTHTGLGVYTKQFVLALAEIDQINQYVLLLRQEVLAEINLPANFKKVVCNLKPYSLKEQLILPIILGRLKPDLVHFTSINVPIFYFGKYLVTVHDLIKHQFTGKEMTTRQQSIYWLKQFGYLAVFRVICKLAKLILVPSQSVKSELVKFYPFTANKISVTYEAATLTQFKSVVSNLAQYNLPPKFCVYTGNPYPHKNLARLIKAWPAVYTATSQQLVLVCGRSVFSQRINKLVKQQNAEQFVKFVGYVRDQDLLAVYRQASAYIFPTLAEGFGLPGLDAMLVGLPVACSDIPVLREVYGPAAVYFNPRDTVDMAAKITELISNQVLRTKVIDFGFIQAARYSWLTCAQETLRLYQLLAK
ncbi:MAG: glycosyltransferase family 1 protein [Candidatus Buchananbacteria bacterium]